MTAFVRPSVRRAGAFLVLLVGALAACGKQESAAPSASTAATARE